MNNADGNYLVGKIMSSWKEKLFWKHLTKIADLKLV